MKPLRSQCVPRDGVVIVATNSRKLVSTGNNNRRVMANIKFFKVGELDKNRSNVDAIMAKDEFA